VRKNEWRSMILAALFAALDIVTTRLLSGPGYYLPPGTYTVRISAQFLWYGLAGWLLGPGWAVGSAVTGDLIGSMMNPTGNGTFFPGYTLTAAASGLLCGLLLYKREPRAWRALLTSGLYCLGVALPQTSLWRDLTGVMPFRPSLLMALPWRAALLVPYGIALLVAQKILQKPLGRLLP